MTTETMTVRVEQGSQPTYAGVRVGVVIAGLHRGVPTARLLIRSAAQSVRLDLGEGESADLFGAGSVTVVQVHPRAYAEQRDEVTLAFRPARASITEEPLPAP